jgi:hypothetical protein
MALCGAPSVTWESWHVKRLRWQRHLGVYYQTLRSEIETLVQNSHRRPIASTARARNILTTDQTKWRVRLIVDAGVAVARIAKPPCCPCAGFEFDNPQIETRRHSRENPKGHG